MDEGKRPRRLKAAEVRALLKDVPYQSDPELSKRFIAVVCRLADGRVLIVYEGRRGLLWESLATLEAALHQPTEPSWDDMIPDPERFAREATALADTLGSRLWVRGRVLDKSLESLRDVDRRLRRLGVHKVLTHEVFPALVAYVGECIRLDISGAWGVRHGAPGLIDSHSEWCSLVGIYKEIYEYRWRGSVEAFAGVQALSHRPRP